MGGAKDRVRRFLWRLGWGTPATPAVKAEVGKVAAALEDDAIARQAAERLDLPGLYRSPACWGGAAERPRGSSAWSPHDWALRCQAASFEIAYALGRRARPFIEEHAYGPLELLHGVALRALLRLEAGSEKPSEALGRAWERLLELDHHARAVALDAFRVSPPPPSRMKRGFVQGLERIATRARDVRSQLLALDPLARLAPDKARRYLPELRRLLVREGQHALEAALLVRALDPRDRSAREMLRHFASSHPDPKVRDAIEARLRPPRPVPGGKA